MDKSKSNGKTFVFGSLSGIASALILQPLDVIRTVQQGMRVDRSQNVRVTQAFTKVLSEDGAVGLWRGIVPSATRVCLGVGLYFVTLRNLLSLFGGEGEGGDSAKHSRTTNFLAGGLARSVAATVLCPVTVIKTRYEWSSKGGNPYTSMWHAAKTITAKEGISGLYSGLSVTIIRDAPYSALYYMCYEALKGQLQDAEWLQNLHPSATNFAAGFLGSGIATVTTHPADVLRTRLMLPPVDGVRKGVLAEMTSIVQSESMWTFTRGISTRILKRGLATAMTWTLFEELWRRHSESTE